LYACSFARGARDTAQSITSWLARARWTAMPSNPSAIDEQEGRRHAGMKYQLAPADAADQDRHVVDVGACDHRVTGGPSVLVLELRLQVLLPTDRP
jgi:hypothetical protein